MGVEVLVVQVDPLPIPPQVCRVVVVGQLLIQVPEEVVEALMVRLADRTAPAEGSLKTPLGPDSARLGTSRRTLQPLTAVSNECSRSWEVSAH